MSRDLFMAISKKMFCCICSEHQESTVKRVKLCFEENQKVKVSNTTNFLKKVTSPQKCVVDEIITVADFVTCVSFSLKMLVNENIKMAVAAKITYTQEHELPKDNFKAGFLGFEMRGYEVD